MSPKTSFPSVPLKEVAKEDVVILAATEPPVVLIVDDEKVIADTLSIILTHAGFITDRPFHRIHFREHPARCRKESLLVRVQPRIGAARTRRSAASRRRRTATASANR